ncbi:MAG: enoyl-CoA hydratase/isomerase family protein [Bacteroidales bacterium]|nr:enoyl-CoA hydratase/isomerase family protein [Bacteroidales bacterium]
MEYQNILTSLDENIFTITINRPKQLNALTKDTIREVGVAISEAKKNNNVKGIIITGSGEKAFIAGADIKEFSDFNVTKGTELSAHGHNVFNSIENCGKPVIAAVNGFALGGGCELAMACHMRIASENAKFSQPEVNLGLIPGYGGTQRMAQLIGKGKAFELLMTADMIDANEAKNLGLVNSVTTLEELLPTVKKLLLKITSKSPYAIKQIIKTVNALYNKELNGFESEIEEFGNCFGTEDFKEGTTAFLEKRKANFTGK